MQAAGDIFLGWQRVEGIDGQTRDFYLRQLRDMKGSAAVERMDPRGMTMYGQLCGWTLARAHARSGDRIALATYLNSDDEFPEAMVEYAEAYADQNERDYQAFLDAIKTGRLDAESGL
jgi:sugar/nucleoside kinase (ribokinase family)